MSVSSPCRSSHQGVWEEGECEGGQRQNHVSPWHKGTVNIFISCILFLFCYLCPFLTLSWPFRRLNLLPPLLSRCPSDRLRSAAWCILALISPDTRIPSFALWIAVCLHCALHCHGSTRDQVPGRLRCSTPWGWAPIPALCNSHSRLRIGLDHSTSYGFVTKRSFSSGRRSGGI